MRGEGETERHRVGAERMRSEGAERTGQTSIERGSLRDTSDY